MKNLSFIEKIDSEIQKHHLLNHSFYKAWNEGALEKETIKEYEWNVNTDKNQFPKSVITKSTIIKLNNGVLKLNNIPFSGFTFDLYSSGKLKSKKQFLNGRKHGYEKYWFLNDSLSTLRHYKNGVKVGIHQSWWKNRQQKFVYHFNDNGKYNGSIKEWYPDGQLAKDFNFA